MAVEVAAGVEAVVVTVGPLGGQEGAAGALLHALFQQGGGNVLVKVQDDVGVHVEVMDEGDRDVGAQVAMGGRPRNPSCHNCGVGGALPVWQVAIVHARDEAIQEGCGVDGCGQW